MFLFFYVDQLLFFLYVDCDILVHFNDLLCAFFALYFVRLLVILVNSNQTNFAINNVFNVIVSTLRTSSLLVFFVKPISQTLHMIIMSTWRNRYLLFSTYIFLANRTIMFVFFPFFVSDLFILHQLF